jgi:SAM-dependent methyltransferase
LASRVKIWGSTLKREVSYSTSDFKERFSGNRNPLVPPIRLRNMVGGASVFMEMAEQFNLAFREVCNLQPYERVLDVGCGAGRIAFPLATYLDKRGSYDGFDISKDAIRWCQKAYRKYPNFHFQVADIYNGQYNSTGKIQSINYKFPYGDASFDFVFLVSVFTHMLPPEVERYTSEISRVLKPSGRCLITYFILDPKLSSYEGCDVNFKFDKGGYRIMDEQMPESAVAYPESTIRELYSKNKLTIIEPVLYGKWAKRQNTKNFSLGQDAIYASKVN